MHAGRRIDANDAVWPDAKLPQLLADAAGLFDHGDENLALFRAPHRRTAADRRPNRRHKRADLQAFGRDQVGKLSNLIVCRVDARVRLGEKEIDAVEFLAVDVGPQR